MFLGTAAWHPFLGQECHKADGNSTKHWLIARPWEKQPGNLCEFKVYEHWISACETYNFPAMRM